MKKLDSNKGFGIAYMIAGMGLVSFSDVILKFFHAYSPFVIIALRSIILLPILVFMLFYKKQLNSILKLNMKEQLLRSGLLAVALVFCIFSLKYMELSQYSALFYSAPIWIALLSIHLLNEQVFSSTWISLAIGWIGVYIALNPFASEVSIIGVGLSGIAVLLYSLGVIFTKKHSESLSPEVILFWNSLVNLAVGLVGVPFVDFEINIRDFPLFIILGLINLLANTLIIKSLSLTQAHTVSLFKYTALIWGTLFGVVFFHEMPSDQFYIGLILIVTSGSLLALGQKKLRT